MGYAIKTKNLVKRYKDKTAVDGLTLTVNEGELIALLGVIGATFSLSSNTGGSKLTSGPSTNCRRMKNKPLPVV